MLRNVRGEDFGSEDMGVVGVTGELGKVAQHELTAPDG